MTIAFRLRYGTGSVDVHLPVSVLCETVEPPESPPVPDERAVVEAAMSAPVGAPPLETLARGKTRVTIVVPDRTRPARTPVVLAAVLGRLAAAGVPTTSCRVLIGGGIHGPTGADEAAATLGPALAGDLEVLSTDADEPSRYDALPEDAALGRPRVHRAVVESDLVVLTGAIAPHYLAGFSGGAKALVPGCADRATVEAAHRLTLDATVAPDGAVRSLLGRLEGNAFRRVLVRIAKRLPATWLVNVGLSDGRIAHAVAGDVEEAHLAGARAHADRFACARPEPAELVIAGGGAPRDRDLLQAHKSLVVASEVSLPGAPIVWLAHAGEGAGHPRFLPWFEAGRLDRHLAALRKAFHPYGLTAYALRWKAARNPVLAVSTQGPDVLRPMGLYPFADAQEAVSHALRMKPVSRCVVLPRAAETFFR